MEYKGNVEPNTAAKLLIALGIITAILGVITGCSTLWAGDAAGRCTESCVGTVVSVEEKARTKYSKHSKHYYEYMTEYNYVVEGHRYRNTSWLTESEQLPVGASIAVHYDPDEPDVSFSEYDDGYNSVAYRVVLWVLTLILLAGGIALIVYGVKLKKQYVGVSPKGKSSGRPRGGKSKGQPRKGKQRSDGRTKGGKARVRL